MKLTYIGRHRPGRWLDLGRRVQISTRWRGADERRHVFFDPIGSVNHYDCEAWSEEEYNRIEDRLGDLLEATEWRVQEHVLYPLVMTCKVCRAQRGGNIEFNVGRASLSIELWWDPMYRVCNALNWLLMTWAERRYR